MSKTSVYMSSPLNGRYHESPGKTTSFAWYRCLESHPTRSIVPEDLFLHSHLGVFNFPIRSTPILQHSPPGTAINCCSQDSPSHWGFAPSCVHSSSLLRRRGF
ncbi:hypothetical protein CDAR_113631 [Caerostris darwini]|uniref:Uncharacterized protein n=1 Tax=Caerostris darwini TaxID=1538125 RepID=A0AAV4NNS5_9ARAC|nr:hypothetical protein CDAR_113631 [Caerostris darwini]